MNNAIFEQDAVVLAFLLIILAAVLYTANSPLPFFRKFYQVVPPILLCYFLPGILNTAGVISGDNSAVYTVASQFLLPASLILLIMGVDLKEIWKLRKKAGLMFIAAALGIVIGGPLAVIIGKALLPGVIVGGEGEDASWRGLGTVAASWTGGSANMAAMYEVFKPSARLYSGMIALDVLISNIWLATLLYGVHKKKKINQWLRADDGDTAGLEQQFKNTNTVERRMATMPEMMLILAVGLGATGLAHLLIGKIVPWIKAVAPQLARFNLTNEFLWLIILTTTFGVLLSFTRARNLERIGSTTVGNVFLYILIASIGMKMNILNVFDTPGLIVIGFIWIAIHAVVIFLVARMFKISYFFLAVASEASVGGVPTASAVAAGFSPALVPVAVLLSVMGYAVGNYAGYICGMLMQWVC
ncbi:Uncharacterized membrane protein [Parapedobacter luteus]|uniref:Uncharacterized membrane protein n=1 Tax=Parapedobacter luteus TaxID=623280 RepID=A0A1T5CV86_9SPHI|nr:DUF819 family protein [Parapedobacter luteus]SKB63334.1 Uncharacterized membrane protein [Parapedobacter luteus]